MFSLSCKICFLGPSAPGKGEVVRATCHFYLDISEKDEYAKIVYQYRGANFDQETKQRGVVMERGFFQFGAMDHPQTVRFRAGLAAHFLQPEEYGRRAELFGPTAAPRGGRARERSGGGSIEADLLRLSFLWCF